jgi:hypothetical protein
MIYEISLSHHSLSRSRVVTYSGTLAGAKRRASAEFGDEFRDYQIVISTIAADGFPEMVAQRRVGSRGWQN